MFDDIQDDNEHDIDVTIAQGRGEDEGEDEEEEDSADEPYDDRADHQIQPRRSLTRHERLQMLADSGCDTREEYEGER